jgi:NodT family efflux transporter outer membrane factor (OMF) lipoprotein
MASYSPDLFGSTSRRVEQAESSAENQRYQLAASYLAVTGNAVLQAINIASARLQIKTVEAIVADDQRNLALVRVKFAAGKAARTDVLAADTQLQSDTVQLPPLRQQLSVARHALATLVGHFPAEWSAPAFDLGEFTLPTELPLSLPSQLVHQRPDILAAEAQLHMASATIGIAQAQMYPNITLSGSLGLEALSVGKLFGSATPGSSILGTIAGPIFHGGALQAQKAAAEEALRVAAAIYRQTVLAAFQQVADILRALQHDAELTETGTRAFELSSSALELQRLSYRAGKSNLLQMLDAERSYQQARLVLARALAQRFQDTAQLFVAMGGGWQNVPRVSAQ